MSNTLEEDSNSRYACFLRWCSTLPDEPGHRGDFIAAAKLVLQRRSGDEEEMASLSRRLETAFHDSAETTDAYQSLLQAWKQSGKS